MHEQVTVAIEVVPHTGCPALGLALEPEVGVLQLQRPVDLLQGHRGTSLRQRIEDEHSIVVRRLGQILRRVSRLRRIIGRRRTRGLALLDWWRLDVFLGSLLGRELTTFC